jgi:hypothetical protein
MVGERFDLRFREIACELAGALVGDRIYYGILGLGELSLLIDDK